MEWEQPEAPPEVSGKYFHPAGSSAALKRMSKLVCGVLEGDRALKGKDVAVFSEETVMHSS